MIIQQIENGKVVGSTTGASDSTSGAQTKSTMDETKEMFLQLLVTEMQYQDPLEPTDNSEYVKELATFTQVETLSAMQGDIQQMTANTMVGKYVSLTDPDTGHVIEGKVDYVTTDAGEQFVSVEGKLYKASMVTSIHDDSYYEAVSMAETFSSLVGQMPAARDLSLADTEKWEILNSIYGDLSTNAKSYLTDETLNQFAAINSKMNELNAQDKAKQEAAVKEDKKATDEKDEDTTTSVSTDSDEKDSSTVTKDTTASGSANSGEEGAPEEQKDNEPKDDEPIATTIA